MKIDQEKCIVCEQCYPYCPVGAIKTVDHAGEPVAEIDQEECVECDVCRDRARVCPVDAIYLPELKWPRSVRLYFSNPHARHPSTDEQGSGAGDDDTGFQHSLLITNFGNTAHASRQIDFAQTCEC